LAYGDSVELSFVVPLDAIEIGGILLIEGGVLSSSATISRRFSSSLKTAHRLRRADPLLHVPGQADARPPRYRSVVWTEAWPSKS
jgi:hypothetical protein